MIRLTQVRVTQPTLVGLAVTQAAAHGNSQIHVQGQVKISHTNWRMLDETIPLGAAQEAARRVGAYLATAKLKALEIVHPWCIEIEDTAKPVVVSMTIKNAGTLEYHCRPHPNMIAKLVATGGAQSQPGKSNERFPGFRPQRSPQELHPILVNFTAAL